MTIVAAAARGGNKRSSRQTNTSSEKPQRPDHARPQASKRGRWLVVPVTPAADEYDLERDTTERIARRRGVSR